MLKLGTYDFWFDGEPIVPGDTLAERLANLEAWGYQGIQLGRPSRELGWPAIQEALAASRIRLLIAGGGGPLVSPDPEARKAGVAKMQAGLRQAADLGAIGSICVPLFGKPNMDPPEPPRTLYGVECEMLVDGLRQVAPVAEETGAIVIVEPLNRYETHFVQRLDQAADICRAVGSPGIKMMADFFHMNIEDADFGESIRAAGTRIRNVHLADSQRLMPGCGHTDFKPGLAALKEIGYDDFMAFECGVPGDPFEEFPQAMDYIRSEWEQA